MVSYAFEKSVGAVLFRRHEGKAKYLLLHYVSGHWDFPKGHIEKGETEIETLRREVEEETGITDLKIIPGFVGGVHYYYRAKGEEREKRKKQGVKTSILKKVTYYLAETQTVDVTTDSHEHQGYEWLEYDEACERITFDNSKRMLKESRRYV